MDPDTNLIQQRVVRDMLVKALDKPMSASNTDRIIELTDELMQLTDALDKWISGGGFLPASWQIAQKAS
jgi:hypothetical protein